MPKTKSSDSPSAETPVAPTQKDARGQMQQSPRSLHTPGPWAVSILGGESNPAPEGLTPAQRERWEQIMADQRRPFRHNDGSFNIIAGQGDDRFPVATAVLRVEKKRGQSHTIEDPEAEANARLIAASPTMFQKLVEYASAMPDEEALAIIAQVEGRETPSV